jgi:hypothetical protein
MGGAGDRDDRGMSAGSPRSCGGSMPMRFKHDLPGEKGLCVLCERVYAFRSKVGKAGGALRKDDLNQDRAYQIGARF